MSSINMGLSASASEGDASGSRTRLIYRCTVHLLMKQHLWQSKTVHERGT